MEETERVGKFYVDLKIVEDHPDVALAILRDMVVMRAECLLFRNVMEYCVKSELFEPVPRQCRPPVYTAAVKVVTDMDGDILDDEITWDVYDEDAQGPENEVIKLRDIVYEGGQHPLDK